MENNNSDESRLLEPVITGFRSMTEGASFEARKDAPTKRASLVLRTQKQTHRKL
jgi:hypothetical protein